jgi:hypothetical protein
MPRPMTRAQHTGSGKYQQRPRTTRRVLEGVTDAGYGSECWRGRSGTRGRVGLCPGLHTPTLTRYDDALCGILRGAECRVFRDRRGDVAGMRVGKAKWQGVGEETLGWRGDQQGEKRVHDADGCRVRSGCEVLTVVCRAGIELAQAQVGKYLQCR